VASGKIAWNAKYVGGIGYSVNTVPTKQEALSRLFDDIPVTDETFIGNFSYSGNAIIFGYKYAGGQYGMLLAWWYNEVGILHLMNVVDGTRFHRTLTGVS